MQAYFDYLLRASVCQALVFLFYSLLLKRITWYSWNRYFLTTFSLLSFIIPFINVTAFTPVKIHETTSFVSQLPAITTNPIITTAASNATLDSFLLLSTVYLLISFALVVRLLIQLLSIRKIKLKATLWSNGEAKIYHVSAPIVPFSFLNNIFVNKDDYSERELQEIIDHEQVHVEQIHTFDILINEIICIISWWNPFAWLIIKAVRENLEYIADAYVISKGVDRKNYQYLLLKVTGDIPFSVTSNLKFSSLKNRITMMNKAKTPPLHLFKFILLIPMIVVLLLAFGNKKENQQHAAAVRSTPEAGFTLSKLTYSIPNQKVKSMVFKEQDKCLLKPGEIFTLTLVSDEKNRLRSLLEKNGYKSINSNAITFLIDSSSTGKSFAVQVNINVGADVVTVEKKRSTSHNTGLFFGEDYSALNEKEDIKYEFGTNFRSGALDIHSYVNGLNSNKPC